MAPEKKWFGLVRRRQCWVPTWRAWLLLVLLAVVLGFFTVRNIYGFLAVNDPRPGGLLVVEGWLPDYALEMALQEYKRNHYDKVIVTGGLLEAGEPLSEYKTYAELGTAILLKLGLGTNDVQAVPAPKVRQDRTYAAAFSMHRWLLQQHVSVSHIHLITEGPHARRSRLLYHQALGPSIQVSVTAVPVGDFDEKHWWRSSAGVRGVIGETIAYLYARLWFRAPKDQS